MTRALPPLLLAGCVTIPIFRDHCEGKCSDPLTSYEEALQQCRVSPWVIGDAPPETDNGCAAAATLKLGDELLARDELGGASRAYWSATTQAARQDTSRLHREERTRDAFEGLARVADKKGQATWAVLLRMCAGLSDAYVKSEQGLDEDAQFEENMRKLKRAREQAEDERSRAAWSNALAAAGNSLAVQTRQVSLNQGLQTAGEISARDRETYKTYADSVAKLDDATNDVVHQVDDAFLETDFRSTFTAVRVAQYLATATDTAPYLTVISQTAQRAGWSQLQPPLASLGRRALAAEQVRPVTDVITDIETRAVKKERLSRAFFGGAAAAAPAPRVASASNVAPAPRVAPAPYVAPARAPDPAPAPAPVAAEGGAPPPPPPPPRADSRCASDADCAALAACETADLKVSGCGDWVAAIERNKGTAAALFAAHEYCAAGRGSGCTAAAENVGRAASRDWQRWLSYIDRACALGDARGCYFLWYSYQGQTPGRPKDDALAAKALQSACRLGLKSSVCGAQ